MSLDKNDPLGVNICSLWAEAERGERGLRRRRRDDRLEIAVMDLLALAFRDNPMNRAVLRRSAGRRVRANRLGAAALVEAALDRGHVLIRTSADGGDPKGALIGFPAGMPPGPTPDLLRELWIALRQGPRVAARWGRVHHEMAAVRPVEPHWMLAMIGVHPDVQARGHGRALLQAWLERVDADRAAAYVETDRADRVGFYRAAGFEPFARRTVHGVEVHALMRPAATD